ncbi:AF4/FMR2 family member 4 [Nymphon striatum]|nr:AF4/FMR2 family member 4 [Nymphon striatum]
MIIEDQKNHVRDESGQNEEEYEIEELYQNDAGDVQMDERTFKTYSRPYTDEYVDGEEGEFFRDSVFEHKIFEEPTRNPCPEGDTLYERLRARLGDSSDVLSACKVSNSSFGRQRNDMKSVVENSSKKFSTKSSKALNSQVISNQFQPSLSQGQPGLNQSHVAPNPGQPGLTSTTTFSNHNPSTHHPTAQSHSQSSSSKSKYNNNNVNNVASKTKDHQLTNHDRTFGIAANSSAANRRVDQPLQQPNSNKPSPYSRQQKQSSTPTKHSKNSASLRLNVETPKQVATISNVNDDKRVESILQSGAGAGASFDNLIHCSMPTNQVERCLPLFHFPSVIPSGFCSPPLLIMCPAYSSFLFCTVTTMSSQKRKVPENGDVSRKTARCSAQQVAAILESDDEETLGFDEDYPSDELKTDSDDNVENDNDSESDSDNENPVDRLPEMQCTVPTPLTGIETPRKEENTFVFPTDNEKKNPVKLDLAKKLETEVVSFMDGKKLLSPLKESKLDQDLEVSEGEDEANAETETNKVSPLPAKIQPFPTPMPVQPVITNNIPSIEKENNNDSSSSSSYDSSSSDSDSGSSSDDDDDDNVTTKMEKSWKPVLLSPNSNGSSASDNDSWSLDPQQQKKSAPSVTVPTNNQLNSKQHSDSQPSSQSWNLASFIKRAQLGERTTTTPCESAAPYDPVGYEEPFGPVQSILSSISSPLADDSVTNKIPSPVPCDAETIVADMSHGVEELPITAGLLSPVQTPHKSHSNNKSVDNETPKTVIKKPEELKEVAPPTTAKRRGRPPGSTKLSKLNAQKIAAVKTAPTKTNSAPTKTNSAPIKTNSTPTKSNSTPTKTNSTPTKTNSAPTKTNSAPTKTNSASNKRKKSNQPASKFKSAEFLSEDSSDEDNSVKSKKKATRKPTLNCENSLKIKTEVTNPNYSTESLVASKEAKKDEPHLSPLTVISKPDNLSIPGQIEISSDIFKVAINRMSSTNNSSISTNKNSEAVTDEHEKENNYHNSHSQSVANNNNVSSTPAVPEKLPEEHVRNKTKSEDGEKKQKKKSESNHHYHDKDKSKEKKISIDHKSQSSNKPSTNNKKEIAESENKKCKKDSSKKRKHEVPAALTSGKDDKVKKKKSSSTVNNAENIKASDSCNAKSSSNENTHTSLSTSSQDKKNRSSKSSSSSSINKSSSSTKESNHLDKKTSHKSSKKRHNESSTQDETTEAKKIKKEEINQKQSIATSSPQTILPPTNGNVKPSSSSSQKHVINPKAVMTPETNSNSQTEKQSSGHHQQNHSTPSDQVSNEKSQQDAKLHSVRYLKSAKAMKHGADRETIRIKKLLKYLEAVLYFILTGHCFETCNPPGDTGTYSMFKDTLNLIKCVFASLRIQSFLCGKLYQLKRHDYREFMSKRLGEYNKDPSKFWLTDCREVSSSAANSATQIAGHVPSNGISAMPSNLTTTANVSSATISPTPSPVDSLNSVGSQSSGYTSEVKTGVSPSHHNSFLIGLVDNFNNLHHLAQCYDLWEQAESTLIKTNCQSGLVRKVQTHCSKLEKIDANTANTATTVLPGSPSLLCFFAELDERNQLTLTMNPNVNDLVKYIMDGLQLIKSTYSSDWSGADS